MGHGNVLSGYWIRGAFSALAVALMLLAGLAACESGSLVDDVVESEEETADGTAGSGDTGDSDTTNGSTDTGTGDAPSGTDGTGGTDGTDGTDTDGTVIPPEIAVFFPDASTRSTILDGYDKSDNPNLDLSPIATGVAEETTVTIRNAGDEELTVDGWSISWVTPDADPGEDPFRWEISPPSSGIALAPKEEQDLTISVKADSEASSTATVEIESNDADESTFTFSLYAAASVC